jgi:hypothetical protein
MQRVQWSGRVLRLPEDAARVARGAMLAGGFAANAGTVEVGVVVGVACILAAVVDKVVGSGLEEEEEETEEEEEEVVEAEEEEEVVEAVEAEEEGSAGEGSVGSIVAKRSNAGGGAEEDGAGFLSLFESRSFALAPSANTAALLVSGTGSASNISSTLDAVLLYSRSIWAALEVE